MLSFFYKLYSFLLESFLEGVRGNLFCKKVPPHSFKQIYFLIIVTPEGRMPACS